MASCEETLLKDVPSQELFHFFQSQEGQEGFRGSHLDHSLLPVRHLINVLYCTESAGFKH